MRTCLLCVAVFLTAVQDLPAAELPNFFLAPVTTALHRRKAGENTSAFLGVNGSAWKKSAGELSSLDEYEAFKDAMEQLAKKKNEHIAVEVRYSLKEYNEPTEAPLRANLKTALEKLCRDAGFKSSIVSDTYRTALWEDDIKYPVEFEEADQAEERMVGNEFVQVFPVRTKLSKYFHYPDDCVVEILKVFDGRDKGITPELDKAIRDAVQQLTFEKPKTLGFQLKATSAGAELAKELFFSTVPLQISPTLSPAMRKILLEDKKAQRISAGQILANELGFARIRFGVRPLNGAPEALIGDEVPDFSLPRLDGTKLQLKSFLKGRPGLVSFWGVACPPCRHEAPLLSEIHNKMGEEVAVVAVNAYSESREDVAKYAKRKKLTHPIVVNGSKVADDKYFVGAYPTTFFIDKDGVVTSYVVGLESVENLTARLKKLMK